jgi:hypothetical protein
MLPRLSPTNSSNAAEIRKPDRQGRIVSRPAKPPSPSRTLLATQTLNPNDWNYHRQDWSFTPREAGAKWMEKFQKLEQPYYPKLELKPKGGGQQRRFTAARAPRIPTADCARQPRRR